MELIRKLKKSIAIMILGMLVLSIPVQAANSEEIKLATDDNPPVLKEMPEIASTGAVVVDMETGYTLYEKNIYEKLYPASITKIMTVILSIENLKLTDTVTFSHDAVYSIEAGSSSGYLREGEQITVQQCLYGLMLISGNDIANGLAETVSGTMDEFAKKMTEKSVELGCKNTNFTNAHGLHDENHYTCAYDMAVIGKYAYDKLDFYRTLISETRYVIEPTEKCDETRYWHNSNRLIEVGQKYYDDDCKGGKTGFTNEAGGTLVTYHEICGRNIMIVVMNAPNAAGTYNDTISICDYIKENVGESYFKSLDDKYEELMEKESESVAEAANSQAVSNNSNIQPGTDAGAEEEKSEAGKFPVPIKVLLFMVVLFVIYYFYISVQRGKRRKHARRYYRKTYQKSRKYRKT